MLNLGRIKGRFLSYSKRSGSLPAKSCNSCFPYIQQDTLLMLHVCFPAERGHAALRPTAKCLKRSVREREHWTYGLEFQSEREKNWKRDSGNLVGLCG